MESLHKFFKICRTALFDIKGSPEQIKEQAKLWGFKLNLDDEIFTKINVFILKWDIVQTLPLVGIY